jgi:hypothetical protein
MQYVVQSSNVSVYLTANINPETEAAIITVSSSKGESSTQVVDSVYAGLVIPIYYLGTRVASACYLPDATGEDIAGLTSELTIFVTKDGTHTPSVSKLVAHLVDDTSIHIANPHDIVYTVILDNQIDTDDADIQMVSPVRYGCNVPMKIISEAVYKPFEGFPGLYIVMGEGPNSMQYTDIPEDAVIKVTYTKPDDDKVHNIFMRSKK